MIQSRTYWCPCNCGWNDDYENVFTYGPRLSAPAEPQGYLLPNGLCPDCQEGNHEVPPDNSSPSLEDLLAQHESIVEQFRKTVLMRQAVHIKYEHLADGRCTGILEYFEPTDD